MSVCLCLYLRPSVLPFLPRDRARCRAEHATVGRGLSRGAHASLRRAWRLLPGTSLRPYEIPCPDGAVCTTTLCDARVCATALCDAPY
eukprot:625168-Rhodomonas_salina.1